MIVNPSGESTVHIVRTGKNRGILQGLPAGEGMVFFFFPEIVYIPHNHDTPSCTSRKTSIFILQFRGLLSIMGKVEPFSFLWKYSIFATFLELCKFRVISNSTFWPGFKMREKKHISRRSSLWNCLCSLGTWWNNILSPEYHLPSMEATPQYISQLLQ